MNADAIRTLLSKGPTGPAGHVAAPEYGPDAKLPVRHLTLAELATVDAIAKGDDKRKPETLRTLFALLLADDAGQPVFASFPPDRVPQELQAVPVTLLTRFAIEGMELATGKGVSDATKKPSPKTGGSS